MLFVTGDHGKRLKIMDHDQLLEKIEKRLDKTDQKIDSLISTINKNYTKIKVLENQMSGVVKVSIILLTSIIGLTVYLIQRGMS